MAKILLIEDEPQMRHGMATILEMEGFAVITAANGQIGVEAAFAESPDLILCDVMMPILDGYGVIEKLRRNERTLGVPFVFLTAKGEKPDIRQGMNLGADDYLTKPIAVDDLLDAIHARLERKEQQLQAAAATLTFKPDFKSPQPLVDHFGLTPKEAEVLLWVAQGKANADVGTILGIGESTVKKHLEHIFEKLQVENRNAATLIAIKALGRPDNRMSGN